MRYLQGSARRLLRMSFPAESEVIIGKLSSMSSLGLVSISNAGSSVKSTQGPVQSQYPLLSPLPGPAVSVPQRYVCPIMSYPGCTRYLLAWPFLPTVVMLSTFFPLSTSAVGLELGLGLGQAQYEYLALEAANRRTTHSSPVG